MYNTARSSYICTMKKKISSTTYILAVAVFFAASMVIFPEVTESGAKTAIIIWANAIVPVLLPFFIFSDFIKRTGNLEKIPLNIYPFAMAFLSGYPVGAKICGDLVIDGSFSREEGIRTLSWSMVTGPAFMLGTIGSLLGSSRAGMVVAIAHYLGAFANGFFFSVSVHAGTCKEPAKPSKTREERFCGENISLLDQFTSAIMTGFRSMAVILAYLMIFMIGIDFLEMAGVFDFVGNPLLTSAMKGMLEMTAGCSMIGMCDAGISVKTVICAVLVSFGGLSVAGQSVSMLSGSGIGITDILKVKAGHGIFAGILAIILVRFMI